MSLDSLHASQSLQGYLMPISAVMNRNDYLESNLFSFGQTFKIKSKLTPPLVHKVKVLRLLNKPFMVESCFYVHRLHETIGGVKTNFTSIFLNHNGKSEVFGLIHQLNDTKNSVDFYDNLTKDTYTKIAEIAHTKGIKETIALFNNNFFYLNTKHLDSEFFKHLRVKYDLKAWFALTDYDSRISNIGHLTAYKTITALKSIFVEQGITHIQIPVEPSIKREFALSNEAFEKYVDIQNTLIFAQYDILSVEQKYAQFNALIAKFIRSNTKAQRIASEISYYLDEFYIDAEQLIQIPLSKKKQLLNAYFLQYRTELSTLDLNSLNRFIQRKNTENIQLNLAKNQ